MDEHFNELHNLWMKLQKSDWVVHYFFPLLENVLFFYLIFFHFVVQSLKVHDTLWRGNVVVGWVTMNK